MIYRRLFKKIYYKHIKNFKNKYKTELSSHIHKIKTEDFDE